MKKHFFCYLFVGFAMLLFFTGCGEEDAKTGTSIVCIGDDYTVGFDQQFNMMLKNYSYPAYLAEKVNIPVVNAGAENETSTQAVSRISNDVLSKDPRIVIIMYGLNDIKSQIFTTTTEENLREIIKKIDNGKRKIYLVKYYTDEIGLAIGKELAGGFIDDAYIQVLISLNNDMFVSLSSLKNVTLIENIWEGIWGVPANMSGNMYPNRDGYKIMADNIFKAMESYLKSNNLIKK